MTRQKGLDLLLEALPVITGRGGRLVVLGTGDTDLEKGFVEAARSNPHQVAVNIGYDEAQSHRIFAGSDCILVPSRFEPCGLNQMYSMRYGTVPIVRKTGGLADTVINYSESNIENSTGFTFDFLDHDALFNTMRWALSIYQEKPANFAKLIENGMNKDFSWKHTAVEYEETYREVLGILEG